MILFVRILCLIALQTVDCELFLLGNKAMCTPRARAHLLNLALHQTLAQLQQLRAQPVLCSGRLACAPEAQVHQQRTAVLLAELGQGGALLRHNTQKAMQGKGRSEGSLTLGNLRRLQC